MVVTYKVTVNGGYNYRGDSYNQLRLCNTSTIGGSIPDRDYGINSFTDNSLCIYLPRIVKTP